MTTPLHDRMVEKYLEAGYRDSHFREFLRLLHYADSELGEPDSPELLDLFCSASRIRVDEAVKAAGRLAGDNGKEYRVIRKSLPVPRSLPDAWRYGESPAFPGRRELMLVEVADFCPMTIFKLVDYGRAADDLETCFMSVIEVNARTGATTLHDPLQALGIWLSHGRPEDDAPKDILDSMADEYSHWLCGKARMIG
jgi:hypothetical protein